MFKLISDDLPATAQPAPSQTSASLIRLWQGSSRSMAPVANCDYLMFYANAIGLQPISYHALNQIYSGVHYKHTFPFTVLEVSVTGCNSTEPRVAIPEGFWFNADVNTLHIYKASKAVSIAVDMAVSAIALATTTPSTYRIDTSIWGDFTSPNPISVDGILFPYSATPNITGTYSIGVDSISVYPTAPLPVGSVLMHVHQELELSPVAAIATYEFSEFALISDFAGRTYLRALDARSPEVYEFLSDDEKYISLYLPLSLFAGTQVELPRTPNGRQSVTSLMYNS